MLTLPASALSGLTEDAKECARMACDNLGIVVLDSAMFTGAGDLSGRTLSFLFSKQINRVSQDRKDLGRRMILPVLNLYYRMFLAKPDGIYLPGLKKVLPILNNFYRDIGTQVLVVQPGEPQVQPDGAPKQVWFCPKMKLTWGDYFEPSDADETAKVTNANLAKEGGIITRKTAIEHVQSVFSGIGNVDKYLAALEKEDQEKRDQLHEDMAAMDGGAPGPSETPPTEGTSRPKPKPKLTKGASSQPDGA
jgi:hypothetical protein